MAWQGAGGEAGYAKRTDIPAGTVPAPDNTGDNSVIFATDTYL